MKWNKQSPGTPSPEADQALSVNSKPKPKAAFQPEGSSSAHLNHSTSSPPSRIPPILLEGDTLPSVEPVKIGPGARPATTVAPSPSRLSMDSELPQGYGLCRLSLTPRDPRCLYASWDLSGAPTGREGNGASSGYPLRLRLFLDGAWGQPVEEIQMPPEARHWLIRVEQPGRSYAAELGYYEPDRQWRSLATSKRVVTPLETVSEERGVQFVTFVMEPSAAQPSPPFPAPPALEAPGAGRPVPVAELIAHAARRPDALPQTGPNVAQASSPASSPGGSPGVDPVGGGGTPPLEFTGGGTPPEPAGEDARATTGGIPEWTAAQEHALAELIGWSLLKQEWLSSAEISQVIQGRPPRLPSSWEAAEVAQLAPVLEALGVSSFAAPLPLEVSSPGAAAAAPEGNFWVSVNAELVVYGATQPDAQVSIGGRPIQLRSDGSFSYRFALPDGSYTLRLQATSAQGESRQAELEFSRGTRYTGAVGAHPQDPALPPPPSKDAR